MFSTLFNYCSFIYRHFHNFTFIFSKSSAADLFYVGLIDWGLTPFLTSSQLYHGGLSSPTHAFPGFLTTALHTTIFPSNWLLFHIDLAHWRKTNDACQLSERKLAEPGFKLTTPGLTACGSTVGKEGLWRPKNTTSAWIFLIKISITEGY